MKKILICICLIGLFSCGIPMKILFKPLGFTYKYDGEYTGLDTIINIDGYYANTDSLVRFTDIKYTENIMFFKNGLFCITSGDPNEFFPRDAVYTPTWGTYRIFGDTIKGQILDDPDPTLPVATYVIEMRIVSDNKINVVLHKNYKEAKKTKRQYLYSLEFHPLENRRDSTNWLLKKKWFHAKKTIE